MKKTFLILSWALAMAHSAGFAQKCGMQILHDRAIANDPSWKQRLDDQRNSLQGQADAYIAQQASGAVQRTTAVSAIPVIFHIVVDSIRFNQLGGTAGIIKRCDSQITVLNRDYNKQNLDANLIPSGWLPLYGNAGIHFGLAHTDPTGHSTPGFEIKIVSNTGFDNSGDGFAAAKNAATGLPSWDVTKYYNVWCINFTDPTVPGLLGLATPKSFAGSGFPLNEIGVCISYNTLGKKTTGAGIFPSPYDQGRTLTHETGHFFEIWHVWGDDGGACSFSGGFDDGIADTPPQADQTFGAPTYTITGGTISDACKLNGATDVQPVGIACLDFMDYTNDAAMYLFTPQQAAAMAAQVLVSAGENYTLTQNPALLQYPVSVTEAKVEDNGLSIYPNPTTGQVTISFNNTDQSLNNIEISNMIGQQVKVITGNGADHYSIDLSVMSKGIYFVKCNFASGSVTRKILLQ